MATAAPKIELPARQGVAGMLIRDRHKLKFCRSDPKKNCCQFRSAWAHQKKNWQKTGHSAINNIL